MVVIVTDINVGTSKSRVGKLLALAQAKQQKALQTSDLQLILNLVAANDSLKQNAANWIPLCLPAFNDGGHLNALVKHLENDVAPTPSPSVSPLN